MQDRTEDLWVIERFIRRQQQTGLIPRELDCHTLALACDALANGLLSDVRMGMDATEAKEVWVTAVARLVRAEGDGN
jgi:hypothetical protein